jgi:hypothetical protein
VTLRDACRRRVVVAALGLALFLAPWSIAGGHASAPARLSDQEFWRLVTDLSEPNGSFRSDNLLSNEIRLQQVIPLLGDLAKPGRAYLGVGPEQNFTYIAALKPAIAFIIDIRRGNLDLQLMYKGLFELSADRADFVSRLFSRKRPEGLSAASSAAEILAAYDAVPPSAGMYYETLKAIRSQLAGRHGLAIPGGDWSGIDFVLKEFLSFGPAIRYSSIGIRYGASAFGGNFPSYEDLMVATDTKGRSHSYLSTEDRFRVVKDLESRNLIVPVVGDFAGTKALRAVGAYLKQRQEVVSAFYLSNVEQYLKLQGMWDAFCANAAMLPVDGTSLFIRSGRFGQASGLSTELGTIEIETGENCPPAASHR